MSTSGQKEPDYLFATEWQGENAGIAYEVGIAVDSSGENIYVAGYDRHKILRFSSNGTYLSEWGGYGTANGQLQYPTDVAVDSGDNVYVSEFQSGKIQKFDRNGNYLAQWPIDIKSGGEDHRGQQGIAVDKSDSIYVADTGYGQILKYSSDGQLIARIGSQGSEQGELSNPNDVAVNLQGNLYVADSFNNRVQVFSSKGDYLAQWTTAGESGELYNPISIAIDLDKNVVYVSAGAIHRFSTDGTYLGPIVNSPPEYQGNSLDIAVDPVDGSVYSFENLHNSNVVQKFRNDQIVAKWAPEPLLDDSRASASSMVTDSVGNVYVVDSLLNRVQKFAPDGTMVGRWVCQVPATVNFSSQST